MTKRLRDRGEIALLEEIRRLIPSAEGVLVGPGDDAAVLERSPHQVLLTTDALVEGVHFRRTWLRARELGARAFEVAASDVAAMGGRVRAVLLAIGAPAGWPVDDLRGVVRGVERAARRAGGALVGGNLALARELALTMTVLGDAPARPLLRSGARNGDQLFVTGRLGGAAFGLRLLTGARSLPGGEAARRCWRRPVARLQAGRALATAGIATAMMDLSDGLLVDAGRLARASGVGLVIDVTRVPLAPALRGLDPRAARRLAMCGGEDYELLFAVSPRRLGGLAALDLACAATRIGHVQAGRGVTVVDAEGRRVPLPRRAGHEHFRP